MLPKSMHLILFCLFASFYINNVSAGNLHHIVVNIHQWTQGLDTITDLIEQSQNNEDDEDSHVTLGLVSGAGNPCNGVKADAYHVVVSAECLRGLMNHSQDSEHFEVRRQIRDQSTKIDRIYLMNRYSDHELKDSAVIQLRDPLHDE